MGEARGEPPAAAARPDTAGSRGLLDRIRFHPVYTSEYSQVRTSQDWNQSLSMTRRIGSAISLRNNWSVSNRRDSAQNELKQKRGQMTFRVDYKVDRFGSWTVGIDGNFRRDSRLSSFRDAIENRSNVSLAVSSKLPQQWMNTLKQLKEFRLDTGMNVGFKREDWANRQATLRDTTRISGLFRSFDAALARKTQKVDFKASVSANRSTGRSRTRQYSAVADTLIQEVDDTSNNSRTLWDGRLQWNPSTSFRATGTGRWIDEVNQYWDTQANNRQGGAETKAGLNRQGQVQIKWVRGEVIDLTGDFKVVDLQTDFDLQERDVRKLSKKGNVDGKVKLPDLVGPLAETELQVIYTGEATSSRQQQTTDYRQRKRTLRASIRRALGRKLTAALTEEISLQQYLYVDRSNDRDEKRMLVDGSLNYRPSQRLNGLFSVYWNKTQLVNIPEEKSANNSTRQTYKVTGDLTYQMGRMRIGQRYTIQADYTFFDFNEDNNTLLRTNGVITTLRGGIGANTTISVKHQYEYKDKGSYVRDAPGDPRRYAPSSEEIRQVLTLGTAYAIGQAIKIDARQLFDQRQRRPVGSDHVTTTLRTEFSLRAEIEKEISPDLEIKVDFAKTESSTEKNYWRGSARIERRF